MDFETSTNDSYVIELIILLSRILDDSYLLQYLRVRKFNVDEAFKTLERGYLGYFRYPQFLDLTEAPKKKMMELLDVGFCYPLKDRDMEGRRVILMQTARSNPDTHTIHDALRLLCFITVVLLEEEETQIAGIVLVFNHENITLKHLMTPVDVRDFMDLVKNLSPARQKESYIMNLPTAGTFMIELFLAAANEKIRKRIKVLKSSDELKEHIDVKLLPKQYGGTTTEEEMLDAFRDLIKRTKENVDKLHSYSQTIDWEKIPKEILYSTEEGDNTGSFRKLEID